MTSLLIAYTLQLIIKIPNKKLGQFPYHIDRIERKIQEQEAISFCYMDGAGFGTAKQTFLLWTDNVTSSIRSKLVMLLDDIS